VSLWLDEPGFLRVEAASAWSSAAQVTDDVARAELGRATAKVAELLDNPSFREVVADRAVRYELVIDYEIGSVLLCTLRNGELEWARR
jgi:hypothetical protein